MHQEMGPKEEVVAGKRPRDGDRQESGQRAGRGVQAGGLRVPPRRSQAPQHRPHRPGLAGGSPAAWENRKPEL